MSKIDMNKPGAHKTIASVEPILRDKKSESYIQYLDACGQLLIKYKSEIEFIESKQKELRREKIAFFEEDLPKIKKSLEGEEIPQEQINDWIKEIKDNYEKSFNASEKILNDFAIASISEIKKRIEENLYG